MRTIRLLIVLFIVLSAVIAIVQYKYNFAFIAQLMGLSWGAMAGAFLGPYLYGLYSKRTTVAAVWVSYILGVGLMLLNMFFQSAFPVWLQSPINCGAFVMLLSLVTTPPGQRHHPPRSPRPMWSRCSPAMARRSP